MLVSGAPGLSGAHHPNAITLSFSSVVYLSCHWEFARQVYISESSEFIMVYVGPQTRTPPVREQGSTVRERVPSVRERVFSTIRSRTAFTRARTDIICARTVIFANGCSPPQHPFVNRYHPFANRHHPLFHQSPELTFTVGCQLFTHRYHPSVRARISQRQEPIHEHTCS